MPPKIFEKGASKGKAPGVFQPQFPAKGKDSGKGKDGKAMKGVGCGYDKGFGKGGFKDSGKKGGFGQKGGFDPMSFGFGGKDKGFDKGKGKGKKGKGKRGPSGPNLERERITEEPVTGSVVEWKGKYGWIEPTMPIEHEKAERHQGKLYVSMSDLVGEIESLTPESICQFHVFVDANGLGAEEVIGS